MRFDEFVEAALYAEPGGFFTEGGGAGRAGADFVTSPEIGPLFGHLVARYLDRVWDDLGQPDRFWVIEAAAGRGALAIAVLASQPRCADALRYLLVERSTALRARQRDHLPVHDGQVYSVADLTEAAALLPEDAAGVVFANELLDNVPFRLLVRSADAPQGWDEVLVARDGDRLVERLGPADAGAADRASSLAPDAVDGARLPLQDRGADWLRDALGVLARGRVVVIDYGDDSASLAARPATEWLRTYRAHERGGDPLDAPGSQDITVEVAWDQMAAVAEPARRTTQRDWLGTLGVDELVAEGHAAWEAAAAAPDLAAIAGRSRAVEADALCDPSGLGAFDVVEWVLSDR